MIINYKNESKIYHKTWQVKNWISHAVNFPFESFVKTEDVIANENRYVKRLINIACIENEKKQLQKL